MAVQSEKIEQRTFLPSRAPWRTRSGRIGLLLIALCWPLNWTLPDNRTSYLFFPLWLGYILTIDSLVWARTNSSLLTRSRRDFILLFLTSAPAWWLFEWINDRTKNWEYLGTAHYSTGQYILLCTVSFSTVMPAVFETAEWVRSFRWVDALAPSHPIGVHRRLLAGCFGLGAAMLSLALLMPKVFYPFVWGSIFLLLEPLNYWLARPTLLQRVAGGDWRPVLSLSLGALICGFFWEMWNFDSFPKWIYHTPGAEVLHLFEMPLLGYLGYIPFAWELFALRSFLWPHPPQLKL